MKKQGFIKSKVMVWLVVANVEKVSQILYINVFPPTFEVDDGDNLWWVWSQQHLGVTYKIHAPFTKYISGTCEWALKGNFYKHQVIILLTYTDLPSKNIIEYYSTYFGIHCGGLKPMFVDLAYLQLDDGAFDDENCNQDCVDEVNIVDIGGFATMDEDCR